MNEQRKCLPRVTALSLSDDIVVVIRFNCENRGSKIIILNGIQNKLLYRFQVIVTQSFP